MTHATQDAQPAGQGTPSLRRRKPCCGNCRSGKPCCGQKKHLRRRPPAPRFERRGGLWLPRQQPFSPLALLQYPRSIEWPGGLRRWDLPAMMPYVFNMSCMPCCQESSGGNPCNCCTSPPGPDQWQLQFAGVAIQNCATCENWNAGPYVLDRTPGNPCSWVGEGECNEGIQLNAICSPFPFVTVQVLTPGGEDYDAFFTTGDLGGDTVDCESEYDPVMSDAQNFICNWAAATCHAAPL